MTLTILTGCRAAFYGEVESLLEHLTSCTEEQLLQHDSQGNTVSLDTAPSRVMHACALDINYVSVESLSDHSIVSDSPIHSRGERLPTVLISHGIEHGCAGAASGCPQAAV